MGKLPRYKLPPALLASLALSWLALRPRSFISDARSWVSALSPLPHVEGRENIPVSGPCLVTFNHYHRPGFNILWLTMVIAAALPVSTERSLKILMTAELTYPGKWYALAGRLVSRFMIRRLAYIYGFITMPPMPPRESDVLARARSVRAVLAWLEQETEPVLLMAPEGGDEPEGRLVFPPPGAGRFIALMAANSLSILPAAGWEESGIIFLRFGPAYRLSLPDDLSRAELDRHISRQVMGAIAALLPVSLRGDFQT